MGRRYRRRRPARRAAFREPRRRLLVFCEGKVTEPAYLKGFEAWSRSSVVKVELGNASGEPQGLLRRAIQRKTDSEREAHRQEDPFLGYDEIWCVVDRDQHARFHAICSEAARQGIHLAISNPCFELWLLLHFREYPGTRTCKALERALRDHIPAYGLRGKAVDFKDFASGYEEAVERAQRQDQQLVRRGEPGSNPSSGVYRLTESIRRGH